MSIKPSENERSCAAFLTDGYSVDFALDLQCAVVAVEGVNDLFGLRVADGQVLGTLVVLLQFAGRRRQKVGVQYGQKQKETTLTSLKLTTLHFFPSSSRTAGFLAAGAADAAGRGEEDAKGFGPLRTCVVLPLRVGFLWVFSKSLTCFKPGRQHCAWLQDVSTFWLH